MSQGAIAYWVGAGLGAIAALSGIALIATRRGTEGGGELALPDGVPLVGGLKVKIATVAGVVFLAGGAAVGLCIWRLTEVRGASKVALGTVQEVENVPENPRIDRSSTRSEVDLKVLKWYLAFFEDARIVIDQGRKEDVRKGDYFATIFNPKRAKDLPREDIGSLQDELTSLIRIASVYGNSSVGALKEYAYDAHLGRLGDKVVSSAGGEIDLRKYAPVVARQRVVAVPREEKAASDGIEDYLADGDAQSGEARRRSYERALEEIEEYRLDFPNGFFAGNVLFDEGIAHFELGEYRAAIRAFERLRERFPFHPSAKAAREWIERAQRKVEH